MYIIIVGAGEVGSYLGRILVEEGHSVALIESDERLARELDAELDALVVHGSGVGHANLERAGVMRADLLLAVTAGDEVNLITCMTANRLSKRLRTVARVREVAYLGGEGALSASELGLDLLVGPERAVAREVVGLLSYEGAGNVHYMAGRRLALLELPLSADSPLVHETLSELRDVFPTPSLIAAISGARGVRIPRGDDRLSVDDRAYVLTLPSNVNEFWILSGKPWHHVRHVLIIGCGDIGFHLATELETRGLYPTILEVDERRAEWVAKRLPRSLVLHGDATDPELLREQLEERADAVVVLIDDNEKALLVGVFARHLGAKKVIVRSDKAAYAPIGHRLGIDALISPKRAVADQILRFVRRGQVESAHMLGDHEVEILELRVPAEPRDPSIITRPLRELDFPQGALVGAVLRGEQVIIPDGEARLQPHDDVFMICTTGSIGGVERLLS
ncbi:MAG TPA: Trk system potassium transporter TrkA [Kofleriaceae bacterium]|nr:Trk system potassium transporter TrkA [Kofleriaceae bacterium]